MGEWVRKLLEAIAAGDGEAAKVVREIARAQASADPCRRRKIRIVLRRFETWFLDGLDVDELVDELDRLVDDEQRRWQRELDNRAQIATLRLER